MAILIDAPPAPASEEEIPDAASPARGGWPRLRADLRLARRAAWRAKGASALVVTLVALPMIGLGGGVVVAASLQPTLAEEVAVELGQASARLDIVSGPDPSLWQHPGDPSWWEIDRDVETGEPVHPEQPMLADPLALLPAGTRTLEIARGSATVHTPAGIGRFAAVVGESWDPSLAGRFEFIAGRAPVGLGEAMVSPGGLTRLEAQVGDVVELAEPEASFTIVGVLKSADEDSPTPAVFLPSSPAVAGLAEYRTWFAPDWQPSADELERFNHQGVVVFARDLMLAGGGDRYVDPGSAWAIASVTAIVAVFAGYLVVLLAGAAFSVSARRQQHSLAVAASVGAPASSLRRIVVLQGTVLGLVGGVVGAGLGIAGGWVALTLLDNGNARSFWGLHVPWWGIAGIVAFAVAVGTVAALVPARNATRGDVLHALRGARKPVSLRTDRPLWGTLLIAVGFGVTVLAGLSLAALNAGEGPIDYSDPRRTLTVWGIIAGPLLFQTGVILAGHWILTRLAGVFSRLGLSARLAARDAAANPGRVVPAFGAIAACVFIGAFALSAVSVFSASTARNYWWHAPDGSIAAFAWGQASDADDAAAVERAAMQALDETGATATAVVRGEPEFHEFVDGVPTDERLRTVFRAEVFGPSCDAPGAVGPCVSEWTRVFGWDSAPRVIAPDELETALGTTVPAEAMRTFRDGGAIVLDTPFMTGTFLDAGEATIREWPGAMLEQDGYLSQNEGVIPDPLRTVILPAVHVDTPHSLPWAFIISPETAERLGMGTAVLRMIAAFDSPPTQVALDRLAQVSAVQSSEGSGFSANLESGPPDPSPWLWLILAAAAVLMLGAGAVALGLARVERRPDDATLTAVGARPVTRRAIAAWQALIIVWLGAVSGTVAGVIPMWGLTLAIEDLELRDMPWLWLSLLALALPVAIAVASWLVRPRHPDLTRRTAIA